MEQFKHVAVIHIHAHPLQRPPLDHDSSQNKSGALWCAMVGPVCAVIFNGVWRQNPQRKKKKKIGRTIKTSQKKIDLKADKNVKKNKKTKQNLILEIKKKTIMLTVRARTSSSLYNMIQAHTV